jgi:hypothetical protein
MPSSDMMKSLSPEMRHAMMSGAGPGADGAVSFRAVQCSLDRFRTSEPRSELL